MIFSVKYQAGSYSGIRKVVAVDEDDAVEQVKRWVSKEMTLPMYYSSYKVVGFCADEEE